MNIATFNIRSSKRRKVIRTRRRIKVFKLRYYWICKKTRKLYNRGIRKLFTYKRRDNKNLNVVGILLAKKNNAKQIKQYVGVSERTALLVLNLNHHIITKINQIYALISTHVDDAIDTFCDDLTDILKSPEKDNNRIL